MTLREKPFMNEPKEKDFNISKSYNSKSSVSSFSIDSDGLLFIRRYSELNFKKSG